MIKRNTEGYVLAYLLIVIAVMGAIAATLMTSTVHVMSAQQNSIRYMQDKYAAMGEIERFLAEVSHSDFSFSGTKSTSELAAAAAYGDLTAGLQSHAINNYSYIGSGDLNNTNYYDLTISYKSGSALITSQIHFVFDIKIIERDVTPPVLEGTPPEEYPEPQYVYDYVSKISALNIDSYEIISIGGDA